MHMALIPPRFTIGQGCSGCVWTMREIRVRRGVGLMKGCLCRASSRKTRLFGGNSDRKLRSPRKRHLSFVRVCFICFLGESRRPAQRSANPLQRIPAHHRVRVPFVLQAAALALRKVPQVNASWFDDFIRQYNHVDVSVAVQTPTGLMVPFIRDTDKKGLAEIAAEVKELAAKVCFLWCWAFGPESSGVGSKFRIIINFRSLPQGSGAVVALMLSRLALIRTPLLL